MATGITGKWNLEQAEKALVVRAIGAFVFDKLRGHTTSLVGAYKASGGGDSTSLQYLKAADAQFASVDFAPAAQALAKAHGGGSFGETFQSWSIPNHELALVERTIGHAYFEKLHGKSCDLTSAYSTLGGSNAQSEQAFKAVSGIWNKIDPSSLIQEFNKVS